MLLGGAVFDQSMDTGLVDIVYREICVVAVCCLRKHMISCSKYLCSLSIGWKILVDFVTRAGS